MHIGSFAMHAPCKSITALTAFAVCARAGILGYTQVNGVTRLLGSSFGIPGLNLTFDYVVRKSHPPLSQKSSFTATS